MTDEELFKAVTTDPIILKYHDSLAMIEWRVTIIIAKRRVSTVKGILGRREPRRVSNLKKYLRDEYGITNN